MSQVQETLDHLFRRESGKIVAYLTRFFGPNHLDLAETVVQEALLKAVQTWPLKGIPENPKAWILRAAKNAAIDHIRKSRDIPQDTEILESLVNNTQEAESPAEFLSEELSDDQLKLMFICCHTSLPKEARIALTLKTLCGFGVSEIARAFLVKEETIAQRLVRAKRKISELGLRYEIPNEKELKERIEVVLEVLYLMFNEGYLATSGESLLRKNLCEEAIYRTTALANHRLGNRPDLYALLALLHFQTSRFNSRTNAQGELLLLEEQDRSLWDQNHIRMGIHFLELSAQGETLSTYHLQAGIASCHAIAPNFESTQWPQILHYYDLLLFQENSPIIALNRIVAFAMVYGWNEGIQELKKIQNHPVLQNYYLLYATAAELYRRKNDKDIAKLFYEKAFSLAGTEPEKRLLQKRIRACSENSI